MTTQEDTMLLSAQARIAELEAQLEALDKNPPHDLSRAGLVSIRHLVANDPATHAALIIEMLDILIESGPLQQSERVPLTDDQIDEIHLANSDAYERGDVEYESHGFARAIEAHYNITGKAEGAQP